MLRKRQIRLIWVKLCSVFEPTHKQIGEKDRLRWTPCQLALCWILWELFEAWRARCTMWREKLESSWYFGWKCCRQKQHQSSLAKIYIFAHSLMFENIYIIFLCCLWVSVASVVSRYVFIKSLGVLFFARRKEKKNVRVREGKNNFIIFFTSTSISKRETKSETGKNLNLSANLLIGKFSKLKNAPIDDKIVIHLISGKRLKIVIKYLNNCLTTSKWVALISGIIIRWYFRENLCIKKT